MYSISIFATSLWRLHTLLFYLSLQICFSYISIVYNSPFQSYLVQFSLIWSTLILFGPISFILSTSVLSGLFFLHWSYSVHYVLFNQHWSYSVHIGPILPLCPLRPYLVIFVCFGSVWSIGSYSRPLRCYKIHFSPFVIIQSILVLFGPFCQP